MTIFSGSDTCARNVWIAIVRCVRAVHQTFNNVLSLFVCLLHGWAEQHKFAPQWSARWDHSTSLSRLKPSSQDLKKPIYLSLDWFLKSTLRLNWYLNGEKRSIWWVPISWWEWSNWRSFNKYPTKLQQIGKQLTQLGFKNEEKVTSTHRMCILIELAIELFIGSTSQSTCLYLSLLQ